MTHFMQLSLSAFGAFSEGKKRVEMRLYDPKRQKIAVGDDIVFTCPERGKLKVKVSGIKIFKSFAQLYEVYPPTELGYADGQCARPEDMRAYYAREDEQKYGVVAIEVADI